MKQVINLYILSNSCPKCKVLKEACESSKIIQNSDFQVSIIDPINNSEDTNYQLLLEHNITMLPVLLVDNDFYDFGNAMKFVRGDNAHAMV